MPASIAPAAPAPPDDMADRLANLTKLGELMNAGLLPWARGRRGAGRPRSARLPASHDSRVPYGPLRPRLVVMWERNDHGDHEHADRAGPRSSPARAAELLHAGGRAGPDRGYYYQLLASAGWASLPLLPLVRRPTLVLAGDDDPLIPLVNGRIMHRVIAGSELHVYRGGYLDLIAEPHRLAP
jgi:pimeloyl-ACP methyl ester carboxylesterase